VDWRPSRARIWSGEWQSMIVVKVLDVDGQVKKKNWPVLWLQVPRTRAAPPSNKGASQHRHRHQAARHPCVFCSSAACNTDDRVRTCGCDRSWSMEELRSTARNRIGLGQ
jgi:hypothetical protein